MSPVVNPVESLPAALKPVIQLASELRHAGFPIAAEQTATFIEAIGILGPNSIQDIRTAAIACYSISPERLAEFELIFQHLFYGIALATKTESEDESIEAHELIAGLQEMDVYESGEESGADAADIERLKHRDFNAPISSLRLAQFERQAQNALPIRKSLRWRNARRGKRLGLRKTLRDSVKFGGEIVSLSHIHRKPRQRNMVLLIDVSGSMKEFTESYLLFAHALCAAAQCVEVFTLGTRLTRITPCLSVQNRQMALARATQLIADVDGGTRLGETLQLFLSVPRYLNMTRGAAVVILSDGLERGDSTDFVLAVQRLSRLAWQLSWLSPLAGDSEYSVNTEALMRVSPFLDQFETGHTLDAVCDHFLNLGRRAA